MEAKMHMYNTSSELYGRFHAPLQNTQVAAAARSVSNIIVEALYLIGSLYYNITLEIK